MRTLLCHLRVPLGDGFFEFLARQRADDVDHGGAVAVGQSHRHESIEQLGGAIQKRRRHADAVGEFADHLDIVLQAGNGALQRLEAPLRHPRRANAELGRAAAAGRDRLDHQVDIDAGLDPERHRLRGRGDMD